MARFVARVISVTAATAWKRGQTIYEGSRRFMAHEYEISDTPKLRRDPYAEKIV